MARLQSGTGADVSDDDIDISYSDEDEDKQMSDEQEGDGFFSGEEGLKDLDGDKE